MRLIKTSFIEVVTEEGQTGNIPAMRKAKMSYTQIYLRYK